MLKADEQKGVLQQMGLYHQLQVDCVMDFFKDSKKLPESFVKAEHIVKHCSIIITDADQDKEETMGLKYKLFAGTSQSCLHLVVRNHHDCFPLNGPEAFLQGEQKLVFDKLHDALKSWFLKRIVPICGEVQHVFEGSSENTTDVLVRYHDRVLHFCVETFRVLPDSEPDDDMFMTSMHVVCYSRSGMCPNIEHIKHNRDLIRGDGDQTWKALVFTVPWDTEEFRFCQEMMVAFACSQHSRLGTDSTVPEKFPPEMLQNIFSLLPEPPKDPKDIFELMFAGLPDVLYLAEHDED
jgi:hypothetical protein